MILAEYRPLLLHRLIVLGFVVLVIGIAIWASRKFQVPRPFNWIIYFVLVVIALLVAYRVIDDLPAY